MFSVLESDFRQLAHDSRKVDGFAGFFHASDHHPEVKEAAERAVLKIRSYSEQPNALEQLRSSKEVLKPLQLSCETKSAKLITQSLSTAQKLLSNDALSSTGIEAVITMMTNVEKVSDESVKLKTLQLALTLLQSPLHPTTEEGIAAVLGICFRTFTAKGGGKDTVSSTAAATVRQAVAIVFSYVDVESELQKLGNGALPAYQQQQQPMSTAPQDATTQQQQQQQPPSSSAVSPELSAAQKLLEDLIAIALGAPPTWLKTPSLPRQYVIEVLDFALANSAPLFRALPAFESTLSLRISQLLQSQMQDYLDAGAAGAALAVSTFPTFRATLRCMRTLLRYYYPQLGGRCGLLVQTVLRGLSSGQPLFQRIAVAQLMKQLLGEPSLVYYLFSTYDMQRERKLDAIHALVRGSVDVIDYALKGGQDGSDHLSRDVAALYQAKSAGKEWTLDSEFDSAPPPTQLAYFTMLSIDSLLAFLSSVERLTSAAVEGAASTGSSNTGGGGGRGSSFSSITNTNATGTTGSTMTTVIAGNDSTGGGGSSSGTNAQQQQQQQRVSKLGDISTTGVSPPGLPGQPVDRAVCEELVDRTWRSSLAVLTQAIHKWSGEELILHLLKGYQSFTQAAGLLQMEAPRDSYLAALCDFALTSRGDGEDVDSPKSVGSGGVPRRSPSFSDEDLAGTILSTKNVQAIRTLFNIAHRLSPVLGSGWSLVLETLNTLDRILESPKTTTQETIAAATAAAGGGGNNSNTLESGDLAILSAAASQLFESTRDMQTEAVVALMAGLRDVSVKHLPEALSQITSGPPRMFALNRMVEVVLINVNRVHDLWGVFLGHVLELVTDPKPAIRSAAIDALGRAIIGTLGGLQQHRLESAVKRGKSQSGGGQGGGDNVVVVASPVVVTPPPQPPPARSRSPSSTGSPKIVSPKIADLVRRFSESEEKLQKEREENLSPPSPQPQQPPPPQQLQQQRENTTTIRTIDSTGGIEHMLLVALEALHNDERERDVRAAVLRVLLSVLQRHGERLTDGWTPVFRLLAVVPEQGDAETTDLGFQCMQLISSDYMSAMPFVRLRRCLQVTVLYGEQGADLNVALTTISMMWNASDMLGRSTGGDEKERQKERNVDGGGDDDDDDGSTDGGKVGQFSAALTPAQVEELQEMVFRALQSLAQDGRPEVRNSGVRTLFAVVVNQGARLPRSLWEQCLWAMLFPLLGHAFHMSATSSKQEAEAALLGKSKGQSVRLVMHHSRNTEQKQWDETVVLALSGMSRLLRAHLPAIMELDGMAAGWEELMVVSESAMAGGRKEVALAAVSLLSVVLTAHGSDRNLITDDMWKRALRSIDVGVEAATMSGCMVPLSVRTETIALIGHVYATLRPRFDVDDTLQVFSWIDAFSRNPWSEDDATSLVQTHGMPPVQKAALVLLPALAPDHAPELWPEFLGRIMKLLQPTHIVEHWKEQKKVAALTAAAEAAAAVEQEGMAGAAGIGVQRKGSTTAQPMPKQAQSKFAMNAAFLEKVLEMVVVPVFEKAPQNIQASSFADLVEALGKCMEVRHTIYQEQLWRSAATTFNQIVPSGLPAIAATISNDQDSSLASDAARAWPALADAFEIFLLGASTTNKHSTRNKSSHPGSPSSTSQTQPTTTATTKPLPMVPIIDIPSSKPQRGSGLSVPRIPSLNRKDSKQQQQQREVVTTATPSPPPEPAINPQQLRADAELEVSVLDTLSDSVLTSCGSASREIQLRLVSIIDAGVVRPSMFAIPTHLVTSAAASGAVGSSFAHVCLRKLYALCSRGGGAAVDPDGSRLAVGRIALPLLVQRADAILRAFCEEIRPGSGTSSGSSTARAAGGSSSHHHPHHISYAQNQYHQHQDTTTPHTTAGSSSSSSVSHATGTTSIEKPRLDEVMCVLEVLAGLTVAPEVSDAVLLPGEPITEVVLSLRQRPEVAARGRERSHLLLLYSSLCGCISSKEVRVREMAKDVLQLAGAELGLGGPLHGLMRHQ